MHECNLTEKLVFILEYCEVLYYIVFEKNHQSFYGKKNI